MIIDTIQEWFKEVLIDGIISNLSGTFDTVNTKVAEIAVNTPAIAINPKSLGSRSLARMMPWMKLKPWTANFAAVVQTIPLNVFCFRLSANLLSLQLLQDHRRIAGGHAIIGDILGHHCIGSYDGSFPNGHAGQDGRLVPDPDTVPDEDRSL